MIRIMLDIPMPRCCMECIFCESDTRCVVKDIRFGFGDDWIEKTRPNWCPLVEENAECRTQNAE